MRLVFVLLIVTSGFPLGVFTGPTPAQAVSVRNATIAFIIFILVFRVVPTSRDLGSVLYFLVNYGI